MKTPTEIAEEILVEHCFKGPHRRHRCKLCEFYWDDDDPPAHRLSCGINVVAAATQAERDRADKAIELLKETYSQAVTRDPKADEDLAGRALQFLFGPDDLSATEKAKDDAVTARLLDQNVKEIERLREALKPFADVADYFDHDSNHTFVDRQSFVTGKSVLLTLGHCRAAKVVLDHPNSTSQEEWAKLVQKWKAEDAARLAVTDL